MSKQGVNFLENLKENNKLIVDIKILDESIKTSIPQYANPGEDTGLDLVATSKTLDSEGNLVYGTNLAIAIPQGFVGLLFPRSSISKKDLALTNCVGVIDSGYRGEIMMKFKPILRYSNIGVIAPVVRENEDKYIEYRNENLHNKSYEIGEKMCQIIILPFPQIKFNIVEKLSESKRGVGGYGSTGK